MLGQASSLGIGLAVYMDDQFTQGAQRVNNTLAAMGLKTKDFADGMSRLDTIGQAMSSFGDKVMGFAKGATQEFATFEHSVNATGIIAGLKRGDKDFRTLGDNAQRLSQIYGQLPEDISQAQLELAKGGKSVQQINQMTEAVISLGAASQEQISGSNGVAGMLLNIMQTYNASSSEAAHYADIMTSAANQSTISVRDLFESLRYSGDVASTLKIPFEETAAAIATLGNSGLKGSMAGTAYANALRFLETGIGIFATKRQQTSLGLLGLSKQDMLDETGHIISMSNLLKILRDRTKTFSDNDKINVLGGIFGVRGNRAILNLLNSTDLDSKGNKMGAFDAMADKIHQDTLRGVAAGTARAMIDDTQGDVQKMTATWVRFKMAIGQSLAPMIRPIVQFLTTVMNHLISFVQGPVGSWLVKWAVILGATMGPLGRILSIGARFAGYMVSSAGRLTNAFSMAQVASNAIRAQITAAAAALTNAALAARGISTFTNRTTGAQMLAARNGAGQFVGGRVARTGMSTFLGTMFGRTGLRWAVGLERMLAPMVAGLGWFTRFFGIVRIVGGVLGRVLGWLFGWEGMLADLILTMLTGKGIFEWLWTGLKTVFGWLFGETDKEKKKEGSGNIVKAPSDDPKNRYWISSPHTNTEQEALDRLRRERPQDFLPKQQIVIHVGPNNSNKAVTHTVDLDHERELQSHSILK